MTSFTISCYHIMSYHKVLKIQIWRGYTAFFMDLIWMLDWSLLISLLLCQIKAHLLMIMTSIFSRARPLPVRIRTTSSKHLGILLLCNFHMTCSSDCMSRDFIYYDTYEMFRVTNSTVMELYLALAYPQSWDLLRCRCHSFSLATTHVLWACKIKRFL